MNVSKALVYLLAVFFLLATIVLVATAVALLIPGTPFDAIWHLYEHRRRELMPYAGVIAPVFLVIGALTGLASLGCFRRRRWGMWFALAIFIDNGLADAFQMFFGNFVSGAIGLAISMLLVFGVLQLSARGGFGR